MCVYELFINLSLPKETKLNQKPELIKLTKIEMT